MSVQVIETQTGAIAASGNASVPLATTLQTNDLVVILTHKSGTGGTPTVTGTNVGVPAPLILQSLQRDSYIHTYTGITGASTPQVNIGTSSGDYAILVLRSTLGNPIFPLFAVGAFDSSVSPAGTQFFTPGDTYVPPGSFACGVLWIGGTPTLHRTPTSGWTDVLTGANSGGRYHHIELATGGQLRARISSASASQAATGTVAVFYDEPLTILRAMALEVVVDNAAPPVLFKGWGVPMR